MQNFDFPVLVLFPWIASNNPYILHLPLVHRRRKRAGAGRRAEHKQKSGAPVFLKDPPTSIHCVSSKLRKGDHKFFNSYNLISQTFLPFPLIHSNHPSYHPPRTQWPKQPLQMQRLRSPKPDTSSTAAVSPSISLPFATIQC